MNNILLYLRHWFSTLQLKSLFAACFASMACWTFSFAFPVSDNIKFILGRYVSSFSYKRPNLSQFFLRKKWQEVVFISQQTFQLNLCQRGLEVEVSAKILFYIVIDVHQACESKPKPSKVGHFSSYDVTLYSLASFSFRVLLQIQVLFRCCWSSWFECNFARNWFLSNCYETTFDKAS